MTGAKSARVLMVLCVAALAVGSTSGPGWTAEIDLYARDGYMSTPDGNSIYIWGLTAEVSGPAQLPGPSLVLAEGESVTIRLHNELPEPASLVFPGQTILTASGDPGLFSPEAGTGGTATYQFIADKPGTFLYHAGSDPGKQVLMGMYGAIIVRPADWSPASMTAYGAGTDTEYDVEYLLITGEIDPVVNAAVEGGSPPNLTSFRPRYWTLNGRCFPDTMLPDGVAFLPNQPYGSLVGCEPGQRVLLRYVGAGVQNHLMHPHGQHTRVIARDGQLLKGAAGEDLSTLNFTVLLGAGQTVDQIYTWYGLGYTPSDPIPTELPDVRNMVLSDPTMYSGSPYLGEKGDLPVGIVSYNLCGEYYFMLHAHEEYQITNWGVFPGGLMTQIAIYPPGGCP